MSDLPPQCSQHLMLSVFARMAKLGAETGLIDEDDDLAFGKIARISPRLAIIERPGDPATSKPRRYTAYRITEGNRFKLDPARVLSVLHETHFASPPDFRNSSRTRVPGSTRRWRRSTPRSSRLRRGRTNRSSR